MDLADDCSELGQIRPDAGTDVSDSDISVLKGIYGRGVTYLEAYAIVLLLKESNPDAAYSLILKTALNLKPYLEKEIKEASASLLV